MKTKEKLHADGVPASDVQDLESSADVANEERAGDVLGASEPLPRPSEQCLICKGARWLRCQLPPWDPEYQSRIACECLLAQRRKKRREQLRALSGLPDEIPSLEGFSPQVRGVQQAFGVSKVLVTRMAGIEQVSNEQQRKEQLVRLGWVLFCGPTGVGKTHLAMAIAGAALAMGIETLFATVPDLLDHLRAAFAPTAELAYDELFERMRKAELLVLDDLGSQRSNEWSEEKLFQLLNDRYTTHLPTVVTLNGRAWTRLDERIRSRLSDVSLVQWVEMQEARDYRPRKQEAERGGGSSTNG